MPCPAATRSLVEAVLSVFLFREGIREPGIDRRKDLLLSISTFLQWLLVCCQKLTELKWQLIHVPKSSVLPKLNSDKSVTAAQSDFYYPCFHTLNFISRFLKSSDFLTTRLYPLYNQVSIEDSLRYKKSKIAVYLPNRTCYILSRFSITQQLIAAGLSRREAVSVAVKVKKELVRHRRFRLQQSALESIVARLISKNIGEKNRITDSFRSLARFYHQRIPLIILIAGTNGVGKSSLARRLASLFNIPCIANTELTITLLESTLKAIGRPVDCHRNFHNNCWLVQQGISAELLKCKLDGKALIIEGRHIDAALCEFISRSFGSLSGSPSTDVSHRTPQALLVPFLLWKQEETLRSRLHKNDSPFNYRDSVSAVVRLQRFLLSQNGENRADRFVRIKIDKSGSMDSILREMHKIVLERIAEKNSG